MESLVDEAGRVRVSRALTRPDRLLILGIDADAFWDLSLIAATALILIPVIAFKLLILAGYGFIFKQLREFCRQPYYWKIYNRSLYQQPVYLRGSRPGAPKYEPPR